MCLLPAVALAVSEVLSAETRWVNDSMDEGTVTETCSSTCSSKASSLICAALICTAGWVACGLERRKRCNGSSASKSRIRGTAAAKAHCTAVIENLLKGTDCSCCGRVARHCELHSTAALRKIATPCSSRATSARQAAHSTRW